MKSLSQRWSWLKSCRHLPLNCCIQPTTSPHAGRCIEHLPTQMLSLWSHRLSSWTNCLFLTWTVNLKPELFHPCESVVLSYLYFIFVFRFFTNCGRIPLFLSNNDIITQNRKWAGVYGTKRRALKCYRIIEWTLVTHSSRNEIVPNIFFFLKRPCFIFPVLPLYIIMCVCACVCLFL